MSEFPTKVLAARMAVDLSSHTGTELHLVHVGELPAMYHPEMRGHTYRHEASQEEARALLDEETDRLRSVGTNVTKTHLRMGRADVEIVELAEELSADVIVVGSRGLGGLRRAHCPVLVVREKEVRRRDPQEPGERQHQVTEKRLASSTFSPLVSDMGWRDVDSETPKDTCTERGTCRRYDPARLDSRRRVHPPLRDECHLG